MGGTAIVGEGRGRQVGEVRTKFILSLSSNAYVQEDYGSY